MLIDTTNPAQVVLQIQSIKADGSPETVLVSAVVRVYHIAGGVEVVDLASTPLVQVGATSFWRYVWVPGILAVGHYFAEYTLVDALAVTKKSVEDIDIRDIATNTNLQLMRYQGAVWVDHYYGYPGTTFPIGTPEYPVSNCTDARAIADGLGLRSYRLLSGILVLSQNHNFWSFYGAGLPSIDPNGFSMDYSYMENIRLCGSATNCFVAAKDCVIWDGFTDINGGLVDCAINDRFLVGAGLTLFHHCTNTMTTPARIYCQGNVVMLHFTLFSGTLEIHDMSAATSSAEIDLCGGSVMIGASCTAGTITVTGTGYVYNNALGTVVYDETVPTQLSNVASDINSLSSNLTLVAADVTTLKKIESGSWRILNNQMIFYDTNGTTPLFTFDLFDENGNPTSTNVFRRVLV